MGAPAAITADHGRSLVPQKLLPTDTPDELRCHPKPTLLFQDRRLSLLEINKPNALVTYLDEKTSELTDFFLAYLDKGYSYTWWFHPVNREIIQVSKTPCIYVLKRNVIGRVRNLGRPFLLGPLHLDEQGFLEAHAAWPLNE